MRKTMLAALVLAAAGALPPRPSAADEPVVVLARFHPAPGREDELQARLSALAEFGQKNNPGVVYRLHRSKSAPAVLLLYETFPSQAALERQTREIFPAFQKLHGAPPAGIVLRPVEQEVFLPVPDSPKIGAHVEAGSPQTSLGPAAARAASTPKETTMQYMLMLYETADDLAHRAEGRNGEYWAGWMAYVDAIRKSGIVRAGAGLEPPKAAATLRTRGGSRKIQDGPFADAKEQLGGFFVIETKTLDEALEWAARAPCASTGGVEVRPVMAPRQP